ncbi:hypothetical protein JCM15415_17700 [Methanobacterium movens]
MGVVKSLQNQTLFIGTPDEDEVVMFLEEDDLFVISAFGKGIEVEKGIKCMSYLLREMASPIIVLGENHPTSQRLKMVVAIGSQVRLDCNIIPGTHPEQDILCSCESLSGVQIKSTPQGVEIEGNLLVKMEKI